MVTDDERLLLRFSSVLVDGVLRVMLVDRLRVCVVEGDIGDLVTPVDVVTVLVALMFRREVLSVSSVSVLLSSSRVLE